MKKKWFIWSLILCLALVNTGCKKDTTETSIDPLVSVTLPEDPAQLTIPTHSGNDFGTMDPTETDITTSTETVPDSTETETTESVSDDDGVCEDPDLGYLNNDPGTEPTKNTMTNQDLTSQTYPVDGGYHVYPLSHTGYSKIGYKNIFDVAPTGISATVLDVLADSQGNLILDCEYFSDGAMEPETLQVYVSGVRCFAGEGQAATLVEYCCNKLESEILRDTSVIIELCENKTNDQNASAINGYVWLGTSSGDQVYLLQEYLLANGYVEPYATCDNTKYKSYFDQYPPLFRSWE